MGRILMWTTLPLTLASWYWDLVATPDDAVLGASQRIFYIHMGAAAVVAAAFTVTACASCLYLATRQLRYDVMASASAEIGTVFTTMLLATGVLWGRVAWGVWWTWDPRLTTTLILWVLFLGYLLLRQGSRERGARARTSAVLAIIFYADVPLDYMTIRWWKSIHPIVITAHGIHMAPSMVAAMSVTMAAMMCLYLAWLHQKMSMAHLEYRLDDVKRQARAYWMAQRWEGRE